MRNNCSDFVGCHAFVFRSFQSGTALQGKKASLRWSVNGDFNPVQMAF